MPPPAIATTSMDLTDELLARAAVGGSVESFEALARRYQVPLLRFLQRGPASREAEDVLQESFLRAFKSLNSFDAGRPFKPWLFAIAYRLAVDHSRQVSKLHRGSSEFEADGRAGPVETLSRTEWADQFWADVRAALGVEPFMAVWLCYGESMPPRQVATAMNRSQVWVRTTLYRARKQLAGILDRVPEQIED